MADRESIQMAAIPDLDILTIPQGALDMGIPIDVTLADVMEQGSYDNTLNRNMGSKFRPQPQLCLTQGNRLVVYIKRMLTQASRIARALAA